MFSFDGKCNVLFFVGLCELLVVHLVNVHLFNI